jgi:hypothetical protein
MGIETSGGALWVHKYRRRESTALVRRTDHERWVPVVGSRWWHPTAPVCEKEASREFQPRRAAIGPCEWASWGGGPPALAGPVESTMRTPSFPRSCPGAPGFRHCWCWCIFLRPTDRCAAWQGCGDAAIGDSIPGLSARKRREAKSW